MSQCLHCSKLCAEDVLFCEDCQAHAEELLQQVISPPDKSPLVVDASPITAPELAAQSALSWPELGSATIPFEPSDSATLAEEDFSHFATLNPDTAEQAVLKLNEAARGIPRSVRGEQSSLRSRLARLKPLRDISSEIQRGSTPHPRIKRRSEYDTQPLEELEQPAEPEPAEPESVDAPAPLAGVTSGAQRPDPRKNATDWLDDPELQPARDPQRSSWSWFHATDESETENDLDLWQDTTDPLAARHRPTIAESAPIEQADLARITFEERPTLASSVVTHHKRRRGLTFWHFLFAALVILVVLVLVVDGLLLTLAFHNAAHRSAPAGGPPALILSANTAQAGERVSVQLVHFAPLTDVALTHDVQESLFTARAAATLAIGTDGQASASFTVNSNWSPGFHLIVAEDVATRNTASAMLQVNGASASSPPHLLLASSALDLGSAAQGANTIQPLVLRNSGSGSISWSASSDQPWLLIAPAQGMFSTGQTISVATQRSKLAPGDYSGTITLFSNVSAPVQLKVSMQVSALPLDAGPVISLVPPLLDFTTTDGSTTPLSQAVTLSNPGQQTLYWELENGPTTTTILQSSGPEGQTPTSTASTSPLLDTPWLSASRTSGWLLPGQTVQIQLTARTQDLLPGAYLEALTLRSTTGTARAYDSPQMLNAALTIQPHCGLLTSTGNLNFTAVTRQSNPSSHALSLNATSSCGSSPLNWQAISSANWITVSPASGQIRGTESGVTSIGVNTALLKPGKYSGVVTLTAGESTQTVLVRLTLQPHPAASEPILGASPLSLNFSALQGQVSPPGQVVTLTNNGGSLLKWRIGAEAASSGWISATPGSGTVLPGQTGQVTIDANTSGLTPGNYVGQVTLLATDARGNVASGSPQTLEVNLAIQPPCTLAQPSQSTLLFNATAGGANPLSQLLTLTSAGSCNWPLHWRASLSSPTSWLTLTPTSGQLTSASQSNTLSVGVNANALQPGTYMAQVQVSAFDASGLAAQNSPQTFNVTLTVLQPCTLQQLPAQINLSAQQGQTTSISQTLALAASGSCNGGVTWTVARDSHSSSWLTLSPTSGQDKGGGSTITASASASGLTPGTYTGQVTVSASNNGVVLRGSPQTITVNLIVTGDSVSGAAVACSSSSPACTGSSPLANATLTLVNNSGTTIATVTSDANGNFTFTNIPQGSYTIDASGVANSLNYTGTTTVTVDGPTTGVSLQAFTS